MIARRFEIPHRRGFGLVEIVVAAVLFAAILMITVQVVGWAALDRKAAARRDAAAHLVANVMERALARPWAEITTEALAPLAAAHPLGTDPQVAGTLRIEVAPAPAVDGRGQKADHRRRRVARPRPGRRGPRPPRRLRLRGRGSQTMRSPACRGHRGGSTLIEMLATITVLTIFLGLAAGLIRLLLRLDQSGRDALAVASDLGRLAPTWRDDIHRAPITPAPAIAADRMTCAGPDDTRIAYTIRPRDLLREVARGDKVVRRETYRLPPHASARFEASTEAGRPFAAVVIHRDDPGPVGRRDDRVDAEVGRFDRQIARHP